MIPFSVEFEEELWGLREDEEAQKAFLDGSEGAKSALPKMVVQVRDPSDARRSGNRRLRSVSDSPRPASLLCAASFDSTRSLTLIFSSISSSLRDTKS